MPDKEIGSVVRERKGDFRAQVEPGYCFTESRYVHIHGEIKRGKRLEHEFTTDRTVRLPATFQATIQDTSA